MYIYIYMCVCVCLSMYALIYSPRPGLRGSGGPPSASSTPNNNDR